MHHESIYNISDPEGEQSSVYTLKCYRAGREIGSLIYERIKQGYYLDQIYVLEGERGKGAGRKLVQKFVSIVGPDKQILADIAHEETKGALVSIFQSRAKRRKEVVIRER